MADIVATYAFRDSESFEAAKYRLSNDLDGGWDTGSNNEYYFIYILSGCDTRRASEICQANGGKVY